jgi:outer membrane autotransporter protein
MSVTVWSGVVVSGGTGLGHAVSLYGGLRNTLANAGTLLTEPLYSLEPQNPLLGQSAAQNAILNTGIEEYVITGAFGNNTVNNTGWVYGNVNLEEFGASGFVNTFNNTATGYFAPGNTVYLGDPANSGNRLINAGVLSPGDFYNVLATNVTGNFTQTSSGVYLNDLDLNPNTADRINATGSASLSGTVMLSFNNPGWAKPGTWNLTILSAAGGRGGSTFTTLASPPSAVFTPSLTYPNPTDADLTYTVNFSPAGLTANEHSVGDAINAIQTKGVAAFRPVAAELFFIPTVPLLGKTYDSLSGEGVSGIEQSIFYSRTQFFNATMMNSSAAIGAGSGPFSLSTGGSAPLAASRFRLWMSAAGGSGYKGADAKYGAAKDAYSADDYTLGLEYLINDTAVIGVSGGETHTTFKVAARETKGHSDGGNFAIYVSAKVGGGYYVSSMLSYGHYQNFEQRSDVGVGLNATHPWTYINQPLMPIGVENTTGNFHSTMVGGEFEVGRKFKFQNGDLTPYINLQFDGQQLSGFDEKAYVTGTMQPGILGLHYEDMSVASVPLSLGVQGDRTFSFANGMSLMPVVRLAWRHEFDPKRPVQAGFEIAPGFDFTTHGAGAPKDALQVNASLVLKVNDSFGVYANFAGDAAKNGSDASGSAGFKVKF